MVALIKRWNPDVLGLQEASDWVGPVKGPRVADDLAARLGGYAVAHTEITPGQPGWMRTARYILYRTSTYKAVGDGGHWTLAPGRFAAYQELQNRTTGARFLAVSVHLSVGRGSRRRPAAAGRDAEAARLRPARTRPSAHVPVIYLGDFNSHEGHALDGPGVAMRAAGVAEDADEVAQALSQPQVQQREPVPAQPRLRATGTSTTCTPPPVWPSGAGPWRST